MEALPSELSSSPLHPSAHVPAKALLQDLPSIIRTAADIKHLAVKNLQPLPETSSLTPSTARPCSLVWPHVQELWPFISLAFSEPRKLTVLGSRYESFTRVNGQTASGFPSVPPLEKSLSSILLPKSTYFGRRNPTPPSPCDQVVASLPTEPTNVQLSWWRRHWHQCQACQSPVSHLTLGFAINWQKRSPFPSQSIINLGVQLDSRTMRAKLSAARLEALRSLPTRVGSLRSLFLHPASPSEWTGMWPL